MPGLYSARVDVVIAGDKDDIVRVRNGGKDLFKNIAASFAQERKPQARGKCKKYE